MKYYPTVKRLFDIAFSTLLIVLSSPVMLACALAIKLNDPEGPVLFRQKRPGYKGHIFTVNKFRSMRVATVDSSGQSLSDMERMLPVGRIIRKLSLDELPQLFNISRGEMSFIGPRPLLVQYLPLYTSEQMRRHDVLPGISGWAQVNGRNTISWESKFKYDVYYVDNICLWLDMTILIKTILSVLKREGINSRDDTTMEPFKGSITNA